MLDIDSWLDPQVVNTIVYSSQYAEAGRTARYRANVVVDKLFYGPCETMVARVRNYIYNQYEDLNGR